MFQTKNVAPANFGHPVSKSYHDHGVASYFLRETTIYHIYTTTINMD